MLLCFAETGRNSLRAAEKTCGDPRLFPPPHIDILPTGLAVPAAVTGFLLGGSVTVTEHRSTDGLLRILSGKTAT